MKKIQDVNASVSEALHSIFSKQLNDTMLLLLNDTIRTLSYFKSRYDHNALLWTSKGKYTALGDSLFKLVREARFYGLIPEDYHLTRLIRLKEKAFDKKDSLYDAFALAETEVLMSDAYFKFGAHLNKGRFYPDSLLLEWNPKKLDSNWVSLLDEGLQRNNLRAAFDSLEPKHDGYKFLKAELRKYILQNAQLDWDSISFVNVKDTVLMYSQIKNRLMITGDYDSTVKGNDSVKLAKAIKKFQRKLNLDPDGKLGKYTRQALSYNKEKVIRQMEMALERWRWEPREFPKRYFWVNIPSADLHIWEYDKKEKRDTLVLYSHVVVGKPDTQTPVVKSRINYMLIYPYWNVPYSIAWKEILPAVQHDTSYLRKKGFECVDGKGRVLDISKLKWKKYTKDYLPFKFRQRIGGDNSLGICKFNFNNKFGIYMHDTNSKRYFKTFYRWQSHGCIRLEKFVETAKFLIRDDTLRTPYDTLMTWFDTPVQRQINVRKPVPIYVKYYTARADDSTGLHLYIDIYRKDEKMMKLVYKGK
ncbi:MAG: L,D-transpeptidase family protein [Bacteroidia bacterium]